MIWFFISWDFWLIIFFVLFATITIFLRTLINISAVSYTHLNGKLRGTLEVERTISKDELEKKALEIENVKKFIEGQTVVKIIVFPGKIVNIVVK